MQYCVDHPEEMNKISKIKSQVAEVKGIMMDNIEKVSYFPLMLCQWYYKIGIAYSSCLTQLRMYCVLEVTAEFALVLCNLALFESELYKRYWASLGFWLWSYERIPSYLFLLAYLFPSHVSVFFYSTRAGSWSWRADWAFGWQDWNSAISGTVAW